jgi:hypothetical protein
MRRTKQQQAFLQQRQQQRLQQKQEPKPDQKPEQQTPQQSKEQQKPEQQKPEQQAQQPQIQPQPMQLPPQQVPLPSPLTSLFSYSAFYKISLPGKGRRKEQGREWQFTLSIFSFLYFYILDKRYISFFWFNVGQPFPF